jgi:hypothetical protein
LGLVTGFIGSRAINKTGHGPAPRCPPGHCRGSRRRGSSPICSETRGWRI